MIDALRAAPALALFVAVGWALDRALGLGLSGAPLRAPIRVMAGLAVVFAAVVHPAAAVSLIVLLALAARVNGGHGRAQLPRAGGERGMIAALLAVAVVGGVCAVARAPIPLYWDEFVWLAKSRVEAGGVGALRDAAIDSSRPAVPPGYPLLWSSAIAWLAAFTREPSALVAADAVLTVLACACCASSFVALTPRAPARAVALPIAFAATAPLLIVHLRSAYADLAVGVLAAAITALLVAPRVVPAAAAVLAAVLAATKDEGLVHVVAISLATAAFAPAGRRRAAARVSAFTVATALAPFVAWRLQLAVHHVDDSDHTLGPLALARVLPLLAEGLRHASDLTTWGVFWSIAGGALVAVAWASMSAARRESLARSRVAAASLVLQALILFGALVAAPKRVITFALAGTLLNRMLVQLAPAAALLVSLVVLDTWLAAPEERYTGDRPR